MSHKEYNIYFKNDNTNKITPFRTGIKYLDSARWLVKLYNKDEKLELGHKYVIIIEDVL